MNLPRRVDLGTVTVAAAVTAVLVVLDPAAGVAEWVFGTVALALLGFGVRAAWRAGQRARAERSRAARLAATEPGAVALAAIREERRRLAEEIAAALRETFEAVLRDVEQAVPVDPRPTFVRIHERTRVATSDLRRQLGLLRASESRTGPAAVAAGRWRRPPAIDLWCAAGLAVLAAVEIPYFLAAEGLEELAPWSVVISVAAAACFAGRTVALGAACLTCAACYLAGSAVGFPVTGGFWFFGTVGTLVWTAAARSRSAADAVAGVLLMASVLGTRRADDPANYAVAVVVLAAAVVLGLMVRLATWREQRSRSRAVVREGELTEAAREAVEAERLGFARDLHDVVSHAVGLIAMQAAAGQVSWPDDPASVRRAMVVIDRSARSALQELDRLGAGRSAARGAADLRALVGRIRASGTAVDLTLDGEVPESLGPVVHRVVQESLTNAVRHAPGSTVHVTVTTAPDGVRARIRDTGTGHRGRAARGYGLTGLAERVALAGGSLHAGPSEPDGFLVEATLPAVRPVVAR